MRRVLLASLFVAASIGLGLGMIGTAGADINPVVPINPILSGVPIYSNVILSFDFSDNSAPPTVNAGSASAGSVSSLAPDGSFNIITDLFPENTGGFIRMVAVAPVGSGVSNLVCPFQPVQQAQAECWFNFLTPGVWTIHAQYASDLKSSVSAESITNLRVGG